jgi:poly-gamma-glutamate system protein
MKRTAVYILCALSAAALVLAKLAAEKPLALRGEMVRAAELMVRAAAAVRTCRQAGGVPLDPAVDINRTGLIDLETSPITTSLGNLAAKRTSTNPNFAALAVYLFHEAGVKKGDAVAIGASGSFPALMVAALCAAETMGVRPLLISSLGASEWGANNPRFDLVSIERCLGRSGLLSFETLAHSLGGDGDVGRDMSPEGRARLAEEAVSSGAPFLDEPDLEKNVGERLALYKRAAGEAGVKAFVNIGGGAANLGTDSEILKVSPGLAAFSRIPPAERRGVIFAMATRGVPVIHLLYVKGLCDRYGLPWDPRPLPSPGEGRLYGLKSISARLFLIITAAYLASVLAVSVWAGLGGRWRAREEP